MIFFNERKAVGDMRILQNIAVGTICCLFSNIQVCFTKMLCALKGDGVILSELTIFRVCELQWLVSTVIALIRKNFNRAKCEVPKV